MLVGAGGEYEVSGCVETQVSHWTIVHPQHVIAVIRGNVPHPDGVVVGAGDDDVLLCGLLVEAEWIPAWLDFTMNCLRLLTVTRPSSFRIGLNL